MDLMTQFIARAKADKQRIVLPEGTEVRTLTAANQVLQEGVAEIILIGNPAEIMALAKENNLGDIEKATIVDPENHEKAEVYANLLFELRKSKGMTIEQAQVTSKDPLYLACLMIKNGDADGQVAGARNTTGNVLRAAFQVIKTQPGIKVVSGMFLMMLKDKSYGEDGVMLFADCAVTPNPTADELAQIAVSTGTSARQLAGIEPRVAILSFSTKGSAKHEMVDKVIEATKIAKEMAPDMCLDGELQADAALVPAIANSKAPGNPLGGKANVLVFPTLETGNICYKLVQRLSGADAVGPILQGIAAPVNDLSRGCSVEDVYKIIAITANQAIGMKNDK